MLENCPPFPKPLLLEIISQSVKKEKAGKKNVSTYLVIGQMFKHKA
jgi:hypothetical protein